MPFSAAAADNSPVRLMGDLDKNHTVDVGDAQGTLNLYVEALAGNSEANADMESGIADINMDGTLTVEDAQYILEYYCQTLTGDAPLWADIRQLSYQDNTVEEYFRTDENGDLLLDSDGNPIPKYGSESYFTLHGMYIEIGCAKGKAGETVTVPVYIAGLPALAGFQLKVVNEVGPHLCGMASQLKKDYPDLDPIWNYNLNEADDPDDQIGLIVAAQAYNAQFKDGYILCELSYQIPDDAESGTFYGIDVGTDYTMFITEECMAYSYTKLSGAIYVE